MDDTFLLTSTQGGEIQLRVESVNHGVHFGSYQVRDQSGELIQYGLLQAGKTITISAQAGEVYHLRIPPRKSVHYRVTVEGAKVGASHFYGKILSMSGDGEGIFVCMPHPGEESGLVAQSGGIQLRKPYTG